MAQDDFSTMMGSLSEFEEYLQTPNLSSKGNLLSGWVFWYPRLLEEYDLAQQNSNVCEEDEREKKIKSLLEALTSLLDDCIVQFWGKKVVAGQLCLTTVGQPFAVRCLRLRKGYCWYRKHCEDHQYIVKEEEVGSVGRAFLNMKVESSPDLRLYSIQEFPLRNHAARSGLRSYLAMPVFDLLNNECYGVLEIVSCGIIFGVAETFSVLDYRLKEVGLRSTHFDSSPIDFFFGSPIDFFFGSKCTRQPESEIVKMMESAMEAVPQLHIVQVWTPCNQCITTTNTLTCLERTAFIHFKDKKLNSCEVNIWEDFTMLNFLKACEFHHLQIEEWIGRPLMSVNRRSSFCRSICDFSICEYPFSHYAQKARLSFCFVIHLQNIYDSNNHCFLEFFVQPSSAGDACDASFLHLLLRIMEMELKNFKFDKSIFELRKTSALGYEYVEWKHQHSEEVNMLTVMKGHTEKYSLSDFKIYLQTPDLFCLQPCEERSQVWLFWREEMSYNEVNNNRGLQEEIRKLMIAIASKWVWRQYSLVQFWALGMNESRPCLQTSHQPFALGSLNKGLAFFRKQCMERRYFVDDGAAGDEVGPPQRVFRSGHHENTPDLHLYSTTEFSLRDHALHCCLKRYIAYPILDQHKKCIGVLECVGVDDDDEMIGTIREALKATSLSSTSLTFSELDESYSSPLKFKIVHYGQKKPQHSINELRHFDPHVMDSVPSVLQEKSSNAATSESREKGVAKKKLVRKRNGSLHIRLEDLEPHFGKTRKQAAKELGVSESTVKRVRKRHGIDRWPNSEKYIKNRRLFEAAGTSHDFQHSHSTNLPPPYVLQPVTELQAEAEMVMVKVNYEEDIIMFKLCLSATMNKLQEEVSKRLDLEIGSFKLKYLYEDNDKILLACDEDLQLCLKGRTAGDKTCVQVFVQLKRMGSCSMKEKVGIEETPGDKIHFHEEAKEADEVIILNADPFLEGKLVELRVESRKDIVAYGAIVRTNGPNEVIHGKKFPSNCMRVAINEVVVKNVLLPIPTDELQLIGDAVGSLVAWPKHLIATRTKMVEKKKKVKEVRKPTLDPTTVPRQLNVLYCYMKLAKTIKISLQKDVFGIESDVHIDFEDVDRFCRLKPISVSCIVVYIWHLFKQLILEDRVSRFKFVDPNGLGPYPGKKTQDEDGERRAHNLLSRLAGTSSNQVLLVPSNIGDHWILTVIDPHKSEVYVLDPLYNGDIDNIWMTVVNLALRLFDVRINKNSRKSSRWSVIKSPRQPDCEQCGFFVLCYMKQIMENYGQMHMCSLQSLFTKMTYSMEEINEMRVEWAECIQEDLYA
ncbi:hypothetical protein ACS0TY_004608 [Phlomoides rotata]